MQKFKNNSTGLWIDTLILQNKKLNSSEKIILAQIIALHNNERCFANNTFFTKIINLETNAISKIINNLVKKGYLLSEIDKAAGNKRILIPVFAKLKTQSIGEKDDSLLLETTIPIVQKRESLLVKKVRPIGENGEHIININNNINKIYKNEFSNKLSSNKKRNS